MKKHKLELTCIGKDERPKRELRLLIKESEKSYQAVCAREASTNFMFEGKIDGKAEYTVAAGSLRFVYL